VETDHLTSPSPLNPLGVKGVGEAGTIASTPAIVNGVLDAIRHLGVQDITMPCTPSRVWQALQSREQGEPAAVQPTNPEQAAGDPNSSGVISPEQGPRTEGGAS
jgi:carbon-monoxide dehydrogenase large subunit